MAATSLILTVVSLDRPGLVESIARQVETCGGNWMESRMAHLGGHFAGIVRVELDATQVDSLRESLYLLKEDGIDVVIHLSPDSDPDSDPDSVKPTPLDLFRLELVGQDRPGIVNQISQILHVHAVNVEDLVTECKSAANSGQILFHASARLRMPSSEAVDALQQELEKIAGDLMIDFSLVRP